jgi:ATP-dependent RNA circularization protein (DNA/RNA ligase family)
MIDLSEKRKEFLRKAGLAIMRPAVKGVMSLVNVDRMVEELTKIDPQDEKAVGSFFGAMKQLLKDVGLEESVLFYMFDELSTTIQKDSDFHAKLRSSLLTGLEKWKKRG